MSAETKNLSLIEPAVREAIESEIPSVTYTAHYMAPKMYHGPDGDFGSHQLVVVSSSLQLEEEHFLRTLLALDDVYDDSSAIDLMVISPASNGTGVARSYEWPRPLRWLKQWEGKCPVPAADSPPVESGLVATAKGVDRKTIEDSLNGTGQIPWGAPPSLDSGKK